MNRPSEPVTVHLEIDGREFGQVLWNPQTLSEDVRQRARNALGYQEALAMESGERRWSFRWLSQPSFARRTEHFPEGTVYRLWLGWFFIKCMVKA